ncbi:aminopeptidase P family protein [Amycolatopsis sp. CA-230715]|uniref:aminopeptidase P family protein n=1 Tax=Amycolatopsis sp. CA-230715 TaxID=2745196 RepID=UPI001C01603C|nr:aminopeptidase P family protein [Amycolatopsis sp. CA-230715]QWF85200.1 Xaa-Pro aminopeptidase 1 [Amycolatopsis sp. CA-230715]
MNETRPARRDPSRLTEATGFREFLREGWGPVDRAVSLPAGAAKAAEDHRRRLSEALPGRRIAVASGWAPVRANDTDYGFRPDSDFAWLTGCDAEGAVLVMRPVPGGHEAELFLRPPALAGEADFFGNARDGELWIGPAPGLREWSDALGVPCRPLDELASAFRGTLPAVLATFRVDPLLDALVPGAEWAELRRTLAELRRVKDDWEVGELRRAVDATIRGFGDVAAELPAAVAGGGERWLEGTFDRRARYEGNGVGYASIVGAGEHAPVLHWTRNDGRVDENAVLLLDAGVEMTSLYTADVTRTLPVSGAYSDAQRRVYDLVLTAHKAALDAVRPGARYSAFHEAAMRVLATGLHDWGVLPVSPEEALEVKNQHHRRYIVCGVGHFLGLDVHDCAHAEPHLYQDGTIEPGMALAVEPGLYFHPNDLTVPPELRGIGVRIEDDVLVTGSGTEVLSAALPVEPGELESWVATRRGASPYNPFSRSE